MARAISSSLPPRPAASARCISDSCSSLLSKSSPQPSMASLHCACASARSRSMRRRRASLPATAWSSARSVSAMATADACSSASSSFSSASPREQRCRSRAALARAPSSITPSVEAPVARSASVSALPRRSSSRRCTSALRAAPAASIRSCRRCTSAPTRSRSEPFSASSSSLWTFQPSASCSQASRSTASLADIVEASSRSCTILASSASQCCAMRSTSSRLKRPRTSACHSRKLPSVSATAAPCSRRSPARLATMPRICSLISPSFPTRRDRLSSKDAAHSASVTLTLSSSCAAQRAASRRWPCVISSKLCSLARRAFLRRAISSPWAWPWSMSWRLAAFSVWMLDMSSSLPSATRSISSLVAAQRSWALVSDLRSTS
mmetsp:Transcript_45650/g.135145  ORF Transcript_45650/g.135145 Transcript_45650/m.135145 type:complete len:380 (-) Transcript_45650:270-1409(-)